MAMGAEARRRATVCGAENDEQEEKVRTTSATRPATIE